MTQGFLETFSAELRSEKWNRGGVDWTSGGN